MFDLSLMKMILPKKAIKIKDHNVGTSERDSLEEIVTKLHVSDPLNSSRSIADYLRHVVDSYVQLQLKEPKSFSKILLNLFGFYKGLILNFQKEGETFEVFHRKHNFNEEIIIRVNNSSHKKEYRFRFGYRDRFGYRERELVGVENPPPRSKY